MKSCIPIIARPLSAAPWPLCLDASDWVWLRMRGCSDFSACCRSHWWPLLSLCILPAEKTG